MSALPSVKIKWLEHLNSAWVEEINADICSRRGVSLLYDKLIVNNEIDCIPMSKVSIIILLHIKHF